MTQQEKKVAPEAWASSQRRGIDSTAADPGHPMGSLPSSRTAASERVMAAGLSRFSDIGFMATTIRDITSQCALTPAAFYNHFESKEALLYTIVSEANSALERRFDDLDYSTLHPSESLAGLVRILVTFNLTYPREAKVANREYMFLGEELRREVVEHRRRVRVTFERVLAAGGMTGSLIGDVKEVVPGDLEIRFLAISILNASIDSSEWFRAAGPLSIPEFAETYCRLALRIAGFERDK